MHTEWAVYVGVSKFGRFSVNLVSYEARHNDILETFLKIKATLKMREF
jgi:hypothetical protein